MIRSATSIYCFSDNNSITRKTSVRDFNNGLTTVCWIA
uniref:Transposase n=1 Tax=Ascaris lumbricoides TaxID=6252 RepID=A0A0M3HLB2_ASCLU